MLSVEFKGIKTAILSLFICCLLTAKTTKLVFTLVHEMKKIDETDD